jgi:hypothetical protein
VVDTTVFVCPFDELFVWLTFLGEFKGLVVIVPYWPITLLISATDTTVR